jgi:integrase/recombinase XerD
MCKTNRSGKSAVLNKRQLEMVFASLPEKYSLLAEILYYSAGRVSEVTNLKVNNINFGDGLVTFEKSSTKTKETRQVPLPPSVLGNLSMWVVSHGLKSNDYIFFTNSRNLKLRAGEKSVSTQSVDNFLRKAYDWSGIQGASTHSMRLSRLTYLHIEAGWSLREIMDISGHKNLISLQQYLDSERAKSFAKYRDLFRKEKA